MSAFEGKADIALGFARRTWVPGTTEIGGLSVPETDKHLVSCERREEYAKSSSEVMTARKQGGGVDVSQSSNQISGKYVAAIPVKTILSCAHIQIIAAPFSVWPS